MATKGQQVPRTRSPRAQARRSASRSRGWRLAHLAAETGSLSDASVERDQRRPDRFGQRDVPPVVGGRCDAAPHPRLQPARMGNRSTRRARRSSWASVATSAEMPPARTARRRMFAASTGSRCGATRSFPRNSACAHSPSLPASTSAATARARVDNDRHDRSASRWSRMVAAGSRLCVLAVRVRARVSKSSTEGRRASSMSSARRCSWSDRPARACPGRELIAHVVGDVPHGD